MIAGLDGIVSPCAAIGVISVPERRLNLTARVVVVHIVGAIQTDLGNGSTPRFEQAEPRSVSGCPRVQKNHGGILGGGNHRINRESKGCGVGNGVAGRRYLNRKNPDCGRRRNGKGERLAVAVATHEWPGWLRGRPWLEPGKC